MNKNIINRERMRENIFPFGGFMPDKAPLEIVGADN